MPKGALITHGNIIANEAAIFDRLDKVNRKVLFDLSESLIEKKITLIKPHLNFTSAHPHVVHYGYLPLAHMLERQASV